MRADIWEGSKSWATKRSVMQPAAVDAPTNAGVEGGSVAYDSSGNTSISKEQSGVTCNSDALILSPSHSVQATRDMKSMPEGPNVIENPSKPVDDAVDVIDLSIPSEI